MKNTAAVGGWRDTAGFGTLRGLMRWQSMRPGNRWWGAMAWVFGFPIMIWIYAVRVLMTNGIARQMAMDARAQTIAELEAEAGIVPALDEHHCPQCGTQATVGAAFCHTCGMDLQPKAMVCPRCASLNQPGAAFCGRCGMRVG